MTSYDVKRIIVAPYKPGDLWLFEPVENIDTDEKQAWRSGMPPGEAWTAFVKTTGAAIACMGLWQHVGHKRAWGAVARDLPAELAADLLRAARILLAQYRRETIIAHAAHAQAERVLSRLSFVSGGAAFPKRMERRP